MIQNNRYANNQQSTLADKITKYDDKKHGSPSLKDTQSIISSSTYCHPYTMYTSNLYQKNSYVFITFIVHSLMYIICYRKCWHSGNNDKSKFLGNDDNSYNGKEIYHCLKYLLSFPNDSRKLSFSSIILIMIRD